MPHAGQHRDQQMTPTPRDTADGHARAASQPEEKVLCVDLDGTLISTDLLWESLLSAARERPWILLATPYWLSRGRPYLKRRLAESCEIDFATLPYRTETLAFLHEEHRRGRTLVLATASHEVLAAGVSRHLGIFRETLATSGATNMKGRVKAHALVGRFGRRNFDYLGDSRADIHCWSEARDAITVGVAPTGEVAHLRRLPVEDPAPAGANRWRLLAKALRPHQWLKNLLLAVPAVGAHQLGGSVLADLALAFASLSLCASGGYVLNDLLDLTADRRHPRKMARPFASGRLSLPTGVALIVLCWALGFGIAVATLPVAYAALMAVYLSATAAYSVRLKKEPVLDVMFLAGLYVLRVVGGGLAIGVPVSTWLLAFTLFICLSLAFLKRFIEVRAKSAVGVGRVPGRGYVAEDAGWLQSAGLASAYLSVLVLALYVNNPDVMRLYTQPERLLLICPVILYGATRVWLNAQRGEIHDDPMVAVAMDHVTYILGAMTAAVVYWSI